MNVSLALLFALLPALNAFSAVEFTGRQKRELRALAGRLEQSKELRRMHSSSRRW